MKACMITALGVSLLVIGPARPGDPIAEVVQKLSQRLGAETTDAKAREEIAEELGQFEPAMHEASSPSQAVKIPMASGRKRHTLWRPWATGSHRRPRSVGRVTDKSTEVRGDAVERLGLHRPAARQRRCPTTIGRPERQGPDDPREGCRGPGSIPPVCENDRPEPRRGPQGRRQRLGRFEGLLHSRSRLASLGPDAQEAVPALLEAIRSKDVRFESRPSPPGFHRASSTRASFQPWYNSLKTTTTAHSGTSSSGALGKRGRGPKRGILLIDTFEARNLPDQGEVYRLRINILSTLAKLPRPRKPLFRCW